METFLLHAQESEALELAGRIHIPSGTRLPADWQGRIVIHWGAAHDELPGQPALQPLKAIVRAQKRTRRDELLRLHGIKTAATHIAPGEQPVFTHKFKVAVFHLQTLAVYEKKEPLLAGAPSVRQMRQQQLAATAYREVTPEFAGFYVRRASREAVKAVYALGLDYGLVTIGILPGGHTLVLDVDPVPKLNGRLIDLFAQAIDRYDAALTKELRRRERVMLGADPEFLLLSPQGKVVYADRFLTRDGAVGCDAIVLSGHRVILPLAELRPQPSTDPRVLTRNLQETMQLASRAITDESLAWLSGGMPAGGYPLGGHIHFSRCWLNAHLLRALDNYLALPLILIEGATTGGRRPRYGSLGDFRRKPHGGFEYRTLPSWLQTPDIAYGVLTLASLIVDHYWLLPLRPLAETDIQAAYYRGDKVMLKSVVTRIWSELSGLKAYSLVAAPLERLRSRIESMAPWNEREDIRKAWKIAPYSRKEAFEEQFML